jgi:uncharacterized protein YjiS (DUF1127 family)
MSTPRAALRRNRSSAGDGFGGWLRRFGAGVGFPGMVRRLAATIVSGMVRRVRIRRNRRATLDLLDLDADRLADIGLTRADVHVALFDPRTPDPTGLLEALAADRRRPGRRRG